MNRPTQIRAILSLVVVLASIVLLIPTFRASSITAAQREAAKSDPARKARIDAIDNKAIRRGLDLQGGMYLVLEIDRGEMSDEQAIDALKRVRETIGNRIDQFGVSEPVIQTVGTSRIVVQLPGLQDPERAKDLIGRTARLEFHLVRTAEDYRTAITKMDEMVRTAAASPKPAPAAAAAAAADTSSPYGALPDVAQTDTSEDVAADSQSPFSSRLIVLPDPENDAIHLYVPEEDVAAVTAMVKSVQHRALPRGSEFQFGMDTSNTNGTVARPLYLINSAIALTGEHLTSARSASDPQLAGNWNVSFSLDRKGDRLFSKITGENVGRLLAISLDGRVKSAPRIIQKIAGGQGVITGTFTNMEASDLALLLRAGALPADVKIAEERTVGPSLGRDSIRQGVLSGMWGAVLVMAFMVMYYRATGIIVVISLITNVMIMLAVLAQFGLVLTLPGIAGIALTIGMSVDANVLINERIREEMRKAKTVRAAVMSGYEIATRTIVDSNMTTLITGLVLLNFGTGPIKGFAVTLCIGILTSMFAALVISRALMDLYTRNKSASLSI